jgi:hypothetical protein
MVVQNIGIIKWLNNKIEKDEKFKICNVSFSFSYVIGKL